MSFKALSALVALAATLSVSAQSAVWGQCGGIGWSGPTTCVAGSTCVVSNAYYSQCLPGSSGGGGTTTAPPVTTTPVTTTSPPATTTPASGGSSGGTSVAGSLDAKFRSHGKKFWGTAADQGTLSNSQDATVTKNDFGGVTPENSMKWASIAPNQGSFSWGGADYLVNWAQTNGKIIRGHTVIWNSQVPSWVTNINDKATLTSVIQNHIAQVLGRYKGKLYAFDIINEHLNEDGTIKSTHFTQVLGNDVFTIALQAARQADPSVKLYINDYNLDSNNAKVQGMVKLVKQLNANGQLVDGIGTQTHLGAGGAGGVQAALTALATAGVEVAITELDIASASASDYETVAKACVAVPACVSVTSWGVRDPDSWRASTNPLLFDSNFQPKAAYNGILSVI